MDKKIVLGSKSPRRQQLMEAAGYSFDTRTLDTDESFGAEMPALQVAEMLAHRKAEALLPTLSDDEILLTADSVVILDNTIYNKPETYEEGIQILSQLSNRTHTVATGVCIRTTTNIDSFTVITEVTFESISREEMDYYLQHFKPYDKAGAYGIQDWIGICKVKKISGSYTNIMGLPMKEVYDHLQKILAI
ncbi:MAG: Maf family protein [Saprospiraceae bacterium]